MTALPSSREVITSLINSIALTGPTASPSSPPPPPPPHHERSNEPLSTRLPPSSRPLLTTLHVLFPSLLLPAFDLLDRSLVTRVILSEPLITDSAHLATASDDASDSPAQNLATETERQENYHHRPDLGVEAEKTVDEQRGPTCHLVRSAGASTSKRSYNALATAASGSPSYIVRLEAWNCSCASFAFDAFPQTVGAQGHLDADVRDEEELLDASYWETSRAAEDQLRDSGGGQDGSWEFGGLSFDGRGHTSAKGGGVPCCKHLLACLLAERWPGVLGSYVVERRASREEMAGLIAGA